LAGVAVLPLANLGASADDEYFSDGITEDIIAQLSQISSLQVISRTSVMRYRKSDRPVREIARELGASHVVEGSIRRAGQRVRIVAQLGEAQSSANLWAETFDRDLTDIFAIQSEVAQRTAAALEARLTPSERSRIEKRPTDDLEAYNQFLLGRRYWDQAGNPGAVEKSIECFTRAIARDPRFAHAYGMLGQVHVWHGGGYFGVRPRDAGDKIMTNAARALELDPDSIEAQFCHAYLASFHRYDWEASERHCSRMAVLNPSWTDGRLLHAFHLMAVGRMDDAVDLAKRLCELDPLSMNIRGHTVLCLLWAGRTDESLEALRVVEAELGDAFFLSWVRTHVMTAVNRGGEIVDSLATWKARVPIALASINHGIALANGGDIVRGREIFVELESRRAKEYLWPVGMAWLAAEIGEMDRAFAYLQQAYDDRAGALNGIAYAQCFDRMRGDPRFDAIQRAVGTITPTSGPAARRLQELAARHLSRAPRQAEAQTPAVAVLPLANLSPSADDEYFSDGITEDIIAQLSQIKSLKVIARTSVMRYKKTEKSAKEIAAELGVSHIATGSVRRAGQRLRIIAQLVDARSEEQLWARTFDRDLTDVFAIQSEVAENTVRALAATLTVDERERITKRPTDSIEAYDLFQLGRFHTGKWSADGWQKGVELLQQAIERDPRYAAPHATLAINYAIRAYVGVLPSKEAFAQAKSEAQIALAIDPSDADAHVALAYVDYFLTWNFEAAVREFQMALAISPGNAHARSLYGSLLDTLGRHDEAMRDRIAAMELSPLDAVATFNVGYGHLIGRHYEDAMKYFRRALELEPHNAGAIYGLGMTQIAAKNPEAACETFEAALAAGDMSTASLGFLGWAYGMAGRTRDAERILAELTAAMSTQYVSPYHLALVYQGLGRTTDLFEWLERSYAERSMWLPWFHITPTFDSVRRDPRFDSLVRRMGLPPDAGLPPQ
jgi:TolB-like protein/Flp pilus assembly protein TadD